MQTQCENLLRRPTHVHARLVAKWLNVPNHLNGHSMSVFLWIGTKISSLLSLSLTIILASNNQNQCLSWHIVLFCSSRILHLWLTSWNILRTPPLVIFLTLHFLCFPYESRVSDSIWVKTYLLQNKNICYANFEFCQQTMVNYWPASYIC